MLKTEDGRTRHVLGLVPARGGSKGVPRKNIRPLAGRPLIAWTIDAALQSTVVDRLIVSTDDSEIATIAAECGAEVPFMRPAELAADDTPDLPVLLHALDWLRVEAHDEPDLVVWLRPTAPMRLASDIDRGAGLLVETGADCVRSVCPSEHHPYWMKRLEDGRLMSFMPGHDERSYYSRQLLPPVYRLNGAVDVVWAERVLRSEDRLFWGWDDIRGYVMPVERSTDIDTEQDLRMVEFLWGKEGRRE